MPVKKNLRTLLTLLLLTVFLGSGIHALRLHAQYGLARDTYDLARETAVSPSGPVRVQLPEMVPPLTPEPSLPSGEEAPPLPEQDLQEAAPDDEPCPEELSRIDLAALRKQNEDVRGWIAIPGTPLDYPIMQGADNQFYLNHTWLGRPSSVGSIFLECQNSGDFTDFNTIIYGHRMRDGSMFASLKYYDSADHFTDHPYVYIVDDAGVHRYEIFAAYEAGVTTSTYYLSFTEERRQEFIDSALERSVIDTGIVPSVHDRILTLSTCTGQGYDTRWVVQARLHAA